MKTTLMKEEKTFKHLKNMFQNISSIKKIGNFILAKNN